MAGMEITADLWGISGKKTIQRFIAVGENAS
jgi:hypothetical protein